MRGWNFCQCCAFYLKSCMWHVAKEMFWTINISKHEFIIFRLFILDKKANYKRRALKVMIIAIFSPLVAVGTISKIFKNRPQSKYTIWINIKFIKTKFQELSFNSLNISHIHNIEQIFNQCVIMFQSKSCKTIKCFFFTN